MKRPVLNLLVAIMIGVFCGEATQARAVEKIKLLIITGGHGFAKEPFFQVFKDNPEIAFTAAAHGKTNADAWEREDLLSYDAVLLYDMPKIITESQKAKMLS